MKLKRIGCKSKGGCLLSIIVFIITLVLISGISFKFISTSLYQQALKELGFNSEQEFNEFSDKMNQPFDDSEILINRPTEADENTAKQILSTSLSLSNGEDVILENGKMNIDSMQTSEDVSVVADINLTPEQLAYVFNLILVSSQAEDDIELARDIELKQIDYHYTSQHSADFNFYLDIDSSGIAEAIGKLGKFVPDRLLINIGTTISFNNDEVIASNCDIKINKLDEQTNEKFLEVLGILMDKTISEVEQWAGDLIAVVFYSFSTEIDCKILFSSDIITIKKIIQGE